MCKSGSECEKSLNIRLIIIINMYANINSSEGNEGIPKFIKPLIDNLKKKYLWILEFQWSLQSKKKYFYKKFAWEFRNPHVKRTRRRGFSRREESSESQIGEWDFAARILRQTKKGHTIDKRNSNIKKHR